MVRIVTTSAETAFTRHHGEMTQHPTAAATSPQSAAASVHRDTASLDAVLRPIRSGNAFEEAVARILQAIKLGAVTVGHRLPPERELARRLGISRVTLREALRALNDAGYVESRRGRTGGTFVMYEPATHVADDPVDLEMVTAQLDDTLTLRSALEPGAAELAAERALDGRARAHLAARLDEVAATDTRATHRLADARLHLAIAEVTGSTSLIAAVADVQMTLATLLSAIPVLPVNIEHSHGQHADIVGAILSGQTERARQQMRDHVHATGALLQGFLS